MPFSTNPEAEYHWRTRYRRQPDTDETPPVSAAPAASPFGIRPRSGGRFSALKNFFRPPRPRRRRLKWLTLSLFAVGGAFAFIVLNDRTPGVGPAPVAREVTSIATSADAAGGAPLSPADLELLVAEFSASREASLVALRGYLLTDSQGFHLEWQGAVAQLQSVTEALNRQSASWTDGLRLVQHAELKRVVERLLAEQRTVAAMIGTPNRYPGLQLFNEDVRPALDEAQRICDEVLDRMLANSSPEDAVTIDPFARLRGDLGDLRGDLDKYATAGSGAVPPAAASTAEFSAMLKSLETARRGAPADLQPKIDRLAFLLGAAQEKLERIFALRAGQRWDYADHAFRTRVLPLAEQLETIAATWHTTG